MTKVSENFVKYLEGSSVLFEVFAHNEQHPLHLAVADGDRSSLSPSKVTIRAW